MKSLIRVMLCCAVLGTMATIGVAVEQPSQEVVKEKVADAALPPGVKCEFGMFDGPIDHMMVFRNGTTMLMSGGPAYRSIIKLTNSGSAPVSVALDIDDATKKAILALAREETGQYWQFEPAGVELAPGEKKDVILFVGLNTGRWNRLTTEDQQKFKSLCDKVKLTKACNKGE